jgi:hypothetical protein
MTNKATIGQDRANVPAVRNTPVRLNQGRFRRLHQRRLRPNIRNEGKQSDTRAYAKHTPIRNHGPRGD